MQLFEMQNQNTGNQSQTITIRVSTLPGYTDCPRRAAAKAWRSIIEGAGFVLRKLSNGIGASIGTGVHAGASYMLYQKKADKPINGKNAGEIAITELRNQTSDGIIWDTTTQNLNTAEKQTIRLTNLFESACVPILKPDLIEHTRKAVIAPGWELSGRSDLETLDEIITDWKMGKIPRPYHPQLGGYSLLRRSQGGTKPKGLLKKQLKRVAIDKPQPPVETIEYDIAKCERAAWAIIGHIKRDITAFLKSGDPWCFACNPMSMMCSEKYCPAHGTTFCELIK
jgi:hypothetical protein